MKLKPFAILVLAVTIGTLGFVTTTENSVATASKGNVTTTSRSRSNNTQKVATVRHEPANEPGVIDGSVNPELIPDRAAYTVLFRLVAGHKNPNDMEAKKRIRQYVRQMGIGRQNCRACDSSQEPNQQAQTDDKDIDAFIAAAEEFQQRASVLDRQVADIKKANFPYPSGAVMATLTKLQHQKEAIVDEIVASLPRRLSADGMEKVRAHVNGRVKRLTKIKVQNGNQGTLLGKLGF